MLSARNILNVQITELKSNEISSLVYAKLPNGKSLKALITTDSAKTLELASGTNALMIFKASAVVVAKNECSVRTSSANELNGTITALTPGAVHAIVEVDCSGVSITAAITSASQQRMQLSVGDNVNVLIKATNVLVGIKE